MSIATMIEPTNTVPIASNVVTNSFSIFDDRISIWYREELARRILCYVVAGK